jgi:alanyl-tRNA synthetase
MRRIEAISGREAEKVVWEKFSIEQRLVQSLQTTSAELETRVSGLLEQLEEKTQQLSVLERKLAIEDAKSLLSEVQIVDGISLITAETSISSSELLRASGDYLKDKIGSGVVALGSVIESNPVIIVMITPDLITRGLHAGNFAKEAAKIIGGGGGGRPESSQAGGKEASKLNEALASIPNLLSKSLDK